MTHDENTVIGLPANPFFSTGIPVCILVLKKCKRSDDQNDFNLNISRYVNTAEAEKEIDLKAVHRDLEGIEKAIVEAKQRHNAFLAELGLPLLP